MGKKEERLHFLVNNQKPLLNEWRGADTYYIKIPAILLWYIADRAIIWTELGSTLGDNVEILTITNIKSNCNRLINKSD
jgi:hypothetical protein